MFYIVLFTIWILYSTYVICCTNHWLDPTSCLSFGAKKWSDPESYRSFWHKPMVWSGILPKFLLTPMVGSGILPTLLHKPIVGSGILSKFVHMFFTKIYNYPALFHTFETFPCTLCRLGDTHFLPGWNETNVHRCTEFSAHIIIFTRRLVHFYTRLKHFHCASLWRFIGEKKQIVRTDLNEKRKHV